MLQQGDTVICPDGRLAMIVNVQPSSCMVRYVGTTMNECYRIDELTPSCESARQLVADLGI